MNTYALVLVVLVAGVSAAPDLQERSNARFGESTVRKMIEDVQKEIRERGLDPYYKKGISGEFRLDEYDIAYVTYVLGDIYFEGLSNMKINHVDVSILLSRLRLDMSIPLLEGGIGESEANLHIFNKKIGGKLSGSIGITEIRINIEVRVAVGILGIRVRSISVNFTIRKIESNIKAKIFGFDLSDPLNDFFNETLPHLLKQHSSEINRFLEQLIKEAIENS